MYIVVAILVFGGLIAVHELGHFFAAKMCGVRVGEFSIGMGPALLKKQRGETLYSLRLLPIGGYCLMDEDDEPSPDDERSFNNQPLYKRVVILSAGSFMNILAGFLALVAVMSTMTSIGNTTIADFYEGFPHQGEHGLMIGDTILRIDGEPVYLTSDINMLLDRNDGKVDVLVRRDGAKILIPGLEWTRREYVTAGGNTVYTNGALVMPVKKTAARVLSWSFFSSLDFVRLVRFTIGDLIVGKAGIDQLSGPVGIVSSINEVGKTSDTLYDAFWDITYFCAFIAVNLAVMNILPLPALDGGRILLMLITSLISKISRRRISPKYEGYVHTVGMVLMLAFAAFIMFNDVMRIIRG